MNDTNELTLSWGELLSAAITVGKSQRDVFLNGTYSLAEHLHRVACFYAYYEIRNERLTLSEAFRTLDPSEKAIVSFYTGMAVTKLYAQKVLDVPWLMHISRYAVAWAVKYGASAKRPDLFGCDPLGNWTVAEAKGRSRVTAGLITKMITQKSAVATVNGSAPAFRIGCASRLVGQQINLRVVDPPAQRRAQEVTIDSAAWLVDYYRPIVDLIRQAGSRSEDGLNLAQLPGSDVEIGLDQEAVDAVDRSRDRQFVRPAPRSTRLEAPVDDDVSDDGFSRRPLADQTTANNQDVIASFMDSAERVRGLDNLFTDGVLIRTLQ